MDSIEQYQEMDESVASQEDKHNALKTFKIQHGTIRLLVHTTRKCVGERRISVPVFGGPTLGTLPSFETRRVAIYENVLDEGEHEVVENYQFLASALGIRLEVVDLGTFGILWKILGRLLRTGSTHRTTTVEISGEAIDLLAKISGAH